MRDLSNESLNSCEAEVKQWKRQRKAQIAEASKRELL